MPENMNQNNQNARTIEEIARIIPSVAATGNQDAVNNLVEIMRTMSGAVNATTVPPTAPKGKYFYARVLTLRTGEKHYHPLIGAMMSPNDVNKPEAYKMLAKDTILELQNDWIATGQKNMAEAAGYKIQAVYVKEEVYKELEKQLLELMTSVIEGLGGNIPKIMDWLRALNENISEEEVLEVLLKEVTKKPFTTGAGVDKDGNIVEKGEYIDEVVETSLCRNSSDDCDHDCENCDDYSEDCERCCLTCDAGPMGTCTCGL